MTFSLPVLVLAALIGSAWSISELAGRWHASAGGLEFTAGLERAQRVSPMNWQYPLARAGVMSVFGKHQDAIRNYHEAIGKFPACSACWIGLAESLSAIGEDPLPALERATALGRSNTGVRTRAAIVYARLGYDGDALTEFRAALGGKRDGFGDFFGMLNRIYGADAVLDDVVTDAELGEYFAFSRAALSPDHVARVWDRFRSLPESGNQRPAYVGYLLARGRFQDAWAVHFDDSTRPGATFLNGDFESYENFGALGWKINNVPGVAADVDYCRDCPTGRRALRIRFDGEHNPHFAGVTQTVAVEGGASYELEVTVRSRSITSAEGPRILVRGLTVSKTSGDLYVAFEATSEQFRGDSPWRTVRVRFTTPEDCEGIRVVIARKETPRLDRFIGGELWLDDFKLVRVDSLIPTDPRSDDRLPLTRGA